VAFQSTANPAEGGNGLWLRAMQELAKSIIPIFVAVLEADSALPIALAARVNAVLMVFSLGLVLTPVNPFRIRLGVDFFARIDRCLACSSNT
jgi:hypothetical protein